MVYVLVFVLCVFVTFCYVMVWILTVRFLCVQLVECIAFFIFLLLFFGRF